MAKILLNIKNGFIEPRDPERFYRNFRTWKNKKLKLISWVNCMTLKIQVNGNKHPIDLSITHFLAENEINCYMDFADTFARI